MRLTFIRKARKNIDHIDNGVVYRHNFGTGWQDLIFPNHEAAERFAIANNCEFSAAGA